MEILRESYLGMFHLRDDYEQVVLGKVDKEPIVLFKPRKMKKEKRVLITALAHGNEPSAFSAILQLVNDGFSNKNVDVSYVPMINPTGFIKGTREDWKGMNPNRGYIRNVDPLSPEGKIIKKHSKILSALAKSAYLDLHEDPDEKNFYLYEYEEEPSKVAKELIKVGRKHFKKVFGGDGILNTKEDNEDGSLEDFMFTSKNIPISIVSEVPGKWPIDKRIKASVEIIKKFVEVISKQKQTK